MSTFTLTHLQRQHDEAEDLVDTLDSTDTDAANETLKDLPTTISLYCKAGRVSELWQMSESLEGQHSASALQLVEERSKIMMINMLAWEWLDNSLEKGLKTRQSTNNTHWTGPLYAAIENIHLTPDIRKTLPATICFPTMTGAPEFVHERPMRRRYSALTDEKLKATAEKVVRTWFSYPKSDYLRMAALLTRKLVDITGPFILLYPPVWNTYTNLRRGIAISSKVTREKVERWANEELPLAPFTRRASEEYKVLLSVCSLYGSRIPFLLEDSSLDVVY